MLEELRQELYYYTEAGKEFIRSEELTGEDEVIYLTKLVTLMQVINTMDAVLNGEEPKTAIINNFTYKEEK